MTSTTDSTGSETVFTYDAQSRLQTITDALGGLYRFEYDAEGALVSASDPRGAVTTFVVDALLRITSVTDPRGIVAANLGYCGGEAQPCCTVDALGNLTTSERDANGNLIRTTDTLGRDVVTHYDALGRQTTVEGPGGSLIELRRNADGHVIAVQDPGGGEIQFGRDSLGRPTSATSQIGHTRTYEYDDAGRLVRDVLPSGSGVTYGYSPSGLRTSMRRDDGVEGLFDYDAGGRPTSIAYSDGSGAGFSYDARGLLTAEWTASHRRSYEYDALGRRTRADDESSGVLLEYEYDRAGNVVRLGASPGGDTSYEYDLSARLIGMVDPDGGRYRFSYDDGGRRVLTAYPNGMTQNVAYDDLSRPIAIVYTDGRGGVVESFSYEYDLQGNPVRKTFADGSSETYAFDEAGRLVRVSYRDGTIAEYSHDAAGNRISMTVDGVESTYEYDLDDRLARVERDGTVTTFAYDPGGNLVEIADDAGVTQLAFDARGLLSGMTDPAGREAQLGYDAHGLLVAIADPDGDRALVLDGRHEFVEIDRTTGELVARVDRDPLGVDHLLAEVRQGSKRTFIRDALGSIYGLVDEDGSQLESVSFDAYGARVGEATTPWAFTGRRALTPDGELTYFRARVYDSIHARWLSSDPLVALDPYRVETAPLLHDILPFDGRYTYANNNPVRYRDPTGQLRYDGIVYWASIDFSLSFLRNPTFLGAITPGLGFGAGVLIAQLKTRCRGDIPGGHDGTLKAPTVTSLMFGISVGGHLSAVFFGASFESDRHYSWTNGEGDPEWSDERYTLDESPVDLMGWSFLVGASFAIGGGGAVQKIKLGASESIGLAGFQGGFDVTILDFFAGRSGAWNAGSRGCCVGYDDECYYCTNP